MRSLLLLSLVSLITDLRSQPFAIGTSVTSYYDALRARNVTCEVHYPATSAGSDTPVEAGAFPVLVVGHGFVMDVNAYGYLWQHFAPLGFIVVLPTTEGGFAPDHAEFGADLAFLAGALQAANTDPLSPFLGHVAPLTALMGHSMGGGAATLGASGSASIQALITMAPAETSPSAIGAAATVQVPTLVFAASEDCVTPIADHAQPIYDALTVPCRALVNITGGGHCYFGDPNFNCTFGEFTCGPNLTITRAEQHDVVLDIAGLWLEHFLLGDGNAYIALLDSLGSSGRFMTQTTCLSTGVAALVNDGPAVFWDPGSQRMVVAEAPAGALIMVHDVSGRELARTFSDGTTTMIAVRVTGRAMLQVTTVDPGSGERRTTRCLTGL